MVYLHLFCFLCFFLFFLHYQILNFHHDFNSECSPVRNETMLLFLAIFCTFSILEHFSSPFLFTAHSLSLPLILFFVTKFCIKTQFCTERKKNLERYKRIKTEKKGGAKMACHARLHNWLSQNLFLIGKNPITLLLFLVV